MVALAEEKRTSQNSKMQPSPYCVPLEALKLVFARLDSQSVQVIAINPEYPQETADNILACQYAANATQSRSS